MIKLTSTPPKSPATLRSALSVLVGLHALVQVASASVSFMDPKTQSCSISYHQSAMVGSTLYIDGGYMWYNNGTNYLGPNVWLRALETSKNFTVSIESEIPIKFLDRPAEVVEITAGNLWAYDGALYQQGGYSERADVNFPGWNTWPNGSVFDFWKYDIKKDSWGIYQHNPYTTSNTPVRRNQHAQSIVIEGLGKAFLISGRQEMANSTTGAMSGSWAYYNGMLIYDFKEGTWEHKDTRWGAWAMGVVNHVAFDNSSSGYILGFAGNVREGGRMDAIEVYDLESKDWGAKYQLATAADARDAIPKPRVKPCSVITRAKDGSSYNIYMFGGWSPDRSVGYNEVWVLSIPSFRWFLVNGGLSATTAGTSTPPAYEAMTCYVVGGGSKMIVYGGRNGPEYKRECVDRTAVHVFDMTKLAWEEDYNANGGEYQVPKLIYDVIGGGPDGGATLLPENGMANSYMEATFKEVIAKARTTWPNTTSTNTGPRDPSGTNNTPDQGMNGSSKSGARVSGGGIAGIVAGLFIGSSLIILGILWLRKRSKAIARSPEISEINGTSFAEMSTTFAPQELHPYGFAQNAQELHAYMPNEMDATINEGQQPEFSDEKAVVEIVQHYTHHDHEGEDVQGQSDDAGSGATQ